MPTTVLGVVYFLFIFIKNSALTLSQKLYNSLSFHQIFIYHHSKSNSNKNNWRVLTDIELNMMCFFNSTAHNIYTKQYPKSMLFEERARDFDAMRAERGAVLNRPRLVL
jgi:hypothetical protein